jgi:hypothetical protein
VQRQLRGGQASPVAPLTRPASPMRTGPPVRKRTQRTHSLVADGALCTVCTLSEWAGPCRSASGPVQRFLSPTSRVGRGQPLAGGGPARMVAGSRPKFQARELIR